jgi:hypothetical protein
MLIKTKGKIEMKIAPYFKKNSKEDVSGQESVAKGVFNCMRMYRSL